ncbi:serine/arginine repetitive matrix protein 2-like [Dreissena polymorpha]|uniref:Uncharacterized protein n=1 Tax=Dreissena polymorpha TaxID=45954 RepID=A0A9D4K5E7_DREPO|nr:serine/arginine repetitive matrix protein 2-like [Dreissena polymorpha]KAH3833390.1 hypothetical protein DPMN_106697 [Dreissena polymorpha]
MDVNLILCVGREDISSVKPSTNIQRQGYVRPSCDDDLRLHLNEPRILPIPPSSCRDSSPQTKSILRSKSPSPKQGSPSSLRNVRFSDKDADNDISPMFTKLHVNDACQTDDPTPCVGTQTNVATPHKPVFERTKPLPYQSRTSTPRNGSLNGAPTLEFNTPREEVIAYRAPSPIRTKVHSEGTNNSSTTRQSRKDMFFSKKVTTSTQFPADMVSSVKSACTQTGMMPENVPDGSRIIRNLDLSASPRSLSPMILPVVVLDSTVESSTQTGEENKKYNSKGTMTAFTPVVPNGEKILQNWARTPQEKFQHETTQTNDSDNESIRSQSPDYPTREINTMEDTLSRLKHKTSQTREVEAENRPPFKHNTSQTGEVDAEKQPPSKHISSQTGEEEKFVSASTQTAVEEDEDYDGNENTKENSRSVCVQTMEPDAFNDTSNTQRSRSIGIQAPSKQEVIPDGRRIIQNMVITPTHDDIPQSNSERNAKMVTDPKWKEFVRSLDISDMSSQIDSEVPETPDTILVNNAEEATHHQRARTDDASPENYELIPCQKLSEHSARSKLQGQSYIRREVDKIKTEVGMKPKSATCPPPVSNPSAFSRKSVSKPCQAWSEPKQDIVPRDVDSRLWLTDTLKTSHNAFVSGSVSPQPVLQRSPDRTGSEILTNRHKGRSNSLAFTPIETHSFKPETVSALRSSMTPQVKKPEPVMAEKLSKNTFIQGLDLGPIPPVPKTTKQLNKSVSYFTSQPSGYKAPSDAMTTSSQRYRNAGQDMGRTSSSKDRSCSAPKSSSPSSLLTPTLNKLRSSVLRKYGKSHDHQTSLPNYRSIKSQSAYDSSTMRQSRYDSYIQGKLSNEERLLRKWATSPPSRYISPSSVNRHMLSSISKASTHSPRRRSPQRQIASTVPVYSPVHSSPQRYVSPTAQQLLSPQRKVSSKNKSDLQYLYLDARENNANKRPTSQEGSPIRGSMNDTQLSRSRSHSPVMNRQSTPTGNGIIHDKTSENNYVSIETSRSIRMPARASSPKQVSSKPPIPKVNKQRRSSSAERSLPGSFRVIGREPRQERREDVNTSSRGTANGTSEVSNHRSSRNTANGSPAISNNGTSRNIANGSPALSTHGSDLRADDIYPQGGTLTVGRAPKGLVNKHSVFLGHDTIQKIIEEANL